MFLRCNIKESLPQPKTTELLIQEDLLSVHKIVLFVAKPAFVKWEKGPMQIKKKPRTNPVNVTVGSILAGVLFNFTNYV
jgi:hypothetical protein